MSVPQRPQQQPVRLLRAVVRQLPLPQHKEYAMDKIFSIKAKCPKCNKELKVSNDGGEVYVCIYCGSPLVIEQQLLPKGEPSVIDGRYVI